MKRLFVRLIVVLLAFLIGVSADAVWERRQGIVNEANSLRTIRID